MFRMTNLLPFHSGAFSNTQLHFPKKRHTFLINCFNDLLRKKKNPGPRIGQDYTDNSFDELKPACICQLFHCPTCESSCSFITEGLESLYASLSDTSGTAWCLTTRCPPLKQIQSKYFTCSSEYAGVKTLALEGLIGGQTYS